MPLVVMLPFDTVLRIIDRAESNVPLDPELADILPLLKKQNTPFISGHCQIALEPVRWAALIGWCYTTRLHDDADIVVGAVATASDPIE